jgi:hypothetical protein
MHDGRRQKPQAAVAVLLVVPAEEDLPKGPAILDRSEPLRKLRTILERFELRFGKRIVVGDLRTAMRFGDPEIGEQQRHRLALHRRAAVCMKGQLPRDDALLRDQRRQVLNAAYAAHPERFVKGRPHAADLPSSVWINPPAKKKTAQDAPRTTIVRVDDPWVDPISTASDYEAVSIIDVNATLIPSTIVSQCH